MPKLFYPDYLGLFVLLNEQNQANRTQETILKGKTQL